MDPRYHGSVMFLPAVLGLLALGSGCLWVVVFVAGGVFFERRERRRLAGGCCASSSSRRRQQYGRLDSDEKSDDDDNDKIGAIGVAHKTRLTGGGNGVLELSAV